MVSVILYGAAIIITIMLLVWSAGLYGEYDPHHDPIFMQNHEPLYCPKCREQREKEGRRY